MPTDQLSSDPTIVGSVSDDRSDVVIRGGFDLENVDDFGTVSFDPGSGSFTISLPQLEELAGGVIPDGPQTFYLQAEDTAGNRSDFVTLPFDLDRIGPTVSLGNGLSSLAVPEFIDVLFSEPVTDPAFEVSHYGLTIATGPDAGTVIPIQSLDVLGPQQVRLNLESRLRSFEYQLQITGSIADLAGNRLAGTRSIDFTVTTPVTISEISPFEGEEMVSPTREIIVRFSDEVDPETFDEDSIYVIANGVRLPGTIRVSSTNRFATFFPVSPLPSATEIRIVVDGDRIASRGGQGIDANNDGTPGGVAEIDFRTLPLTRIEGTNMFGYVFDSLLKNADGSDVPLVGATIRVDAFPEANVTTDENGFFELVDMPAPEFFVHIDGSTASHVKIDGELVSISNDKTYPSVGKPFHSLPGQRIQVSKPPSLEYPNGKPFDIYLPRMDVGDIQTLSPDQATPVGFGDQALADLQEILPGVSEAALRNLAVEFPAGSAINDDGDAATTAIVVPVPPERIPAPLPASIEPMDPPLVISIQAPGASSFDEPAPITFPNLDGAAPG